MIQKEECKEKLRIEKIGTNEAAVVLLYSSALESIIPIVSPKASSPEFFSLTFSRKNKSCLLLQGSNGNKTIRGYNSFKREKRA